MHNITRSSIPIAICLALILTLVGGFFRFYQLSDGPYWMDEGITIVAAQAIQEQGNQILDSGFSYTCPLYCYPSAWFGDLLGTSPFSYRLLAAIAGTAFILMLFFILRRMFDLRITLLATFFSAFSYFQIAWSRQARWYTLFELFFWLAISGFYHAYYEEKGRKRWIFLTVVFTILAAQAHELGYLLPLVFVGWMLLDAVVSKKLSLKVFVPLVTLGTFVVILLSDKLGIEPTYLFPLYLLFYFKSYWIFFLLSILAFFHPYNVWKKETYFLLFVLLSYVIPLSFLTDIINYRYLFHLTPIFFILGSIGIVSILSDLKSRWMKIGMLAIVTLFFFVSGMGVLKPSVSYLLEADGRRFFIPQPDWNKAYGFIKNNKKSGEIVITTQPSFNKIFLGEPGYWIRYSYNGKTYMKERDDKEFYVGAKIINDVSEFEDVVTSSHGYLTIDVYAERLIPQEIKNYIENNLEEVFNEKTNEYSEVSVYRF